MKETLDANDVMSTLNNIYITTTGTGTTGTLHIGNPGSGTISTLGGAGHGSTSINWDYKKYFADELHKTHVDELKKAEGDHYMKILDTLIDKISGPAKFTELDEYEEGALKHLRYAKAYLEKKLLDKINQTIDGKRNPDRKEG
jgi:hypothetical protein